MLCRYHEFRRAAGLETARLYTDAELEAEVEKRLAVAQQSIDEQMSRQNGNVT